MKKWIIKLCSIIMFVGELTGQTYNTIFNHIKELFFVNEEQETEVRRVLEDKLIVSNKSTLFKDYDAEALHHAIKADIDICQALIIQGQAIAFSKTLQNRFFGNGILNEKIAAETNLRVVYATILFLSSCDKQKITKILRDAVRSDEEVEAVVMLSYFQPESAELLLKQASTMKSSYKIEAFKSLKDIQDKKGVGNNEIFHR